MCIVTSLQSLGHSKVDLQRNTMTVSGFNQTQNQTSGEINLDLLIGDHIFKVHFQVVDIAASFTLLLGCPWLHQASVIPSTLHQKIKLIVEDELVVIPASKEIRICGGQCVLEVQHVEPEARYFSYQFEEVSTLEKVKKITEKKRRLPPKFRMMAHMGFDPRKGLCKRNKGKTHR